MFKKKNIIGGLILAVAVGLLAGCDGQSGEANKLVDEANAAMNKVKPATGKADTMIADLLGPNMTKAEDLEQYKTENKAKFDETVSLFEQSEKGLSEAADKFDQASKLKVDDKFKEYLNLSAQEFRKRAERQKSSAAFLKAFLAEKDAAKCDQMIGDNNKKDAALLKEADDFRAKSDKIMKDNPGVFQSK